jgi:hypothetical protein
MPPTDELPERNRAALKLLFEAAQALSDGERDYAVRLQRQAARHLSPRLGSRLAAVERWRNSLTYSDRSQ